jgi:uncharacterized protein with HEPN domain
MKKQSMSEKKLVIEILQQIYTALQKIQRRFEKINSPGDFLDSEYGMDMLDAICMQLVSIGESIKNIDKITNQKLLINYPEIDWRGIKGIRDIISHHYFDVDAEEIFNIGENYLKPLMITVNRMISDLQNNSSYKG